MLGTKQKSSSDVLDYDVSYEAWLTDDDTITTVTTEVSPSGELEVDTVQVSSPEVKVWVSGGVNGETYDVTVTAATSGGRVKEQCFRIRVRDCRNGA